MPTAGELWPGSRLAPGSVERMYEIQPVSRNDLWLVQRVSHVRRRVTVGDQGEGSQPKVVDYFRERIERLSGRCIPRLQDVMKWLVLSDEHKINEPVDRDADFREIQLAVAVDVADRRILEEVQHAAVVLRGVG